MKFASLMGLIFMSFTAFAEPYKLSDHYDGKTFHNPGRNDLKSFWQVLKWKMTADTKKWPDEVANNNYPFRSRLETEKVSATFVNHSTFLLQLPGINVLTDPVYSDRVSPFSFAGPKRVRAPGLPFDNLPPIDVVLVSHNHYDHLDLETLKQLDGKFKPLFLVPLGDEKLLLKNGIQNVKALDWWEEVRIKDTRFIFTPSQHWSARSLWDKNECLWGSFMIDNGTQKIYFAGDTGYGDHFKNTAARLGNPDLALLPIGAYKPRWFMQFHHMDPDDAVMAHKDLGSKKTIGIHYGTFQLTDEGVDEPVKDLKVAIEKHQISDSDFFVIEQGDSYSY